MTLHKYNRSMLATAVSLSLVFSAHANDTSVNGVQANSTQIDNNDIEHIAVTHQKQPFRGDVALKDTPQAVSIISSDLLQQAGIKSFQNALDFSSGIVRQNSFGGMWDGFAIRGFAGDENLPSGYLINGFSAGRGYSGKRNTTNIETIEILKGPGSALYGRSEPGGTINIITKKPQFFEQGYLQVSAGNYDTFRVEGDYTNALNNDFAYRINGSYDDSGSFRDHVDTKSTNINPSFLWNISDKTNLTYEIEYLDQQVPFDRGIVVVNRGTADAPDYDYNAIPVERFLGELNDKPMDIDAVGHQLVLQHKINQDWDLLAGLGYRDSSFKGFASDSRLRGPAEDGTLLRQRRHRDYQAKDLSARVELSGNVKTGDITHHILIGLDTYDYKLDTLQSRYRSSDYTINIYNPIYAQGALPEVAVNQDRKEEQNATGIYLQNQIDITEQWSVLAGIRFDQFEQKVTNNLNDSTSSQDQNETSPRIGIVYKANDAITFYASYAEGFRPNSGADVFGNTFDPEESESSEIGVKFNNDELFSATLALYSAKKSNILTADVVNGGSVALGEAESEGVELDLTANLTENTLLSFAYAYTDAKTVNTVVNRDWGVEIPAGSPLINIAEHTANLTLQHALTIASKEANIGVSYNYVGDRLGETITPSYELPSYSVVRLFASMAVNNNIELMFDVDNIFNETYMASSYHRDWTMPGAPVNYKLSVKYQF